MKKGEKEELNIVDVLNREEFICRVIRMAELILSNKGNMTFAINGPWGCGKTFVLEKVEKRLQMDESKNYLIIHYNCWQYDYYDEPLIAIISTLLATLDGTKKINQGTKNKIKKTTKAVLKSILKAGGQILETKTGLNTTLISDTISESTSDAESKCCGESFDSYFDLRITLEKLKKELVELANKRALVFCVDELDRCLPEYAIRVLERLHHFTEKLPNTLTIIAIDKTRLENTIDTIFGGSNNRKGSTANEYLKKFIRFELTLDKGKQESSKFFDKYPDFFNKFDGTLFGALNGTERFLEELFCEIDIRSQEQIVEKASLLNDICFGDEKQDYSLMYMELFSTVLVYYYHDRSLFNENRAIYNPGNVFKLYESIPAQFKKETSGFNFSKEKTRKTIGGFSQVKGIVIDASNIFLVVFCYWFYSASRNDFPSLNDYSGQEAFYPDYQNLMSHRLIDNIDRIEKFVSVMKELS